MALAETAKLMSELNLKDNFTPAANKAMKSLGRMESTAFRVGQNIGKGFKNAATNLKRIAEVGVVALAGAITLGVRSLGDLARTQGQTEAVIKSTGGAAKVTADQVRSMANNLENLSTVDDKVIQDGENMLLTFTNISGKVFPQATKAALDMAVAMANGNVENVDLKASAIQLGKALNDPVKGITALKKVGVTFDAQQVKRIKRFVKEGKVIEAQKVILAEINKEFGKSAEAAGKGPEAVMRRLADAGENVSQILARATLPVLERLGTFLTSKLNDPAFLKAVDDFGTQLGIAGGKFLDFIEKVDFTAIGNALKIGADAAGTIIDAFLKAPTWLQEAIVTGWGLNKLTGGAVSGIFGELASGLIKGVLGMNAGVVNINAAVVNGAGGPGDLIGKGLPAAIPGAAAAGAAGIGLGTIAVLAIAPASIAAIGLAVTKRNAELPGIASTASARGVPDWNNKALTKLNVIAENTAPRNTSGSPDDRDKTSTSVEHLKGKIADDLAANKNAIDAAAQRNTSATDRGASTVARATSGAGALVAQAVRSSQPIMNTDVRVYVTAAGVSSSVTKQNRYGPGNGSAGGSTGGMLNDRER